MRATAIVIPVLVGIVLLLFGCETGGPPVISMLTAEPDSVHQGGNATLRCRAEDPDGGSLTIEWYPDSGVVAPTTGDSVNYRAPDVDMDDTVRVTVTDDEGEVADSLLVINVAEGLCGGTPEILAVTDSRTIVADTHRVFYADDNAVRWVGVSGLDSGVVVEVGLPMALGSPLVGYGANLYCLVSEDAGDRLRLDRLLRVAKDRGTADTLFAFGNDSVVTDLTADDGGVFVAWYEQNAPSEDSVRVHISWVPDGGGTLDDLHTEREDASLTPRFTRLLHHEGSLYYLATFVVDVSKGALSRLDLKSRAVSELVQLDTLWSGDWLVRAGDRLFWSESGTGRIGMVALDGQSQQYIQPSGGRASGVDGLVAAQSLGEHLVFWTAEDDLRGMVAETGMTAEDLERGVGNFRVLTANDAFLFYVWDNGGGNQLYRLFMR